MNLTNFYPIDREDLIRRVKEGDHSKCKDAHDLLDTCPIELGLAVLKRREEADEFDKLLPN